MSVVVATEGLIAMSIRLRCQKPSCRTRFDVHEREVFFDEKTDRLPAGAYTCPTCHLGELEYDTHDGTRRGRPVRQPGEFTMHELTAPYCWACLEVILAGSQVAADDQGFKIHARCAASARARGHEREGATVESLTIRHLDQFLAERGHPRVLYINLEDFQTLRSCARAAGNDVDGDFFRTGVTTVRPALRILDVSFRPLLEQAKQPEKKAREVRGSKVVSGMAGVNVPRYRSHKEVEALKIDRIRPEPVSGAILYCGGFAVYVSSEYLEKHDPQVGGYWVRYEDGYESWSPGPVFEAGYTRIPSLSEQTDSL